MLRFIRAARSAAVAVLFGAVYACDVSSTAPAAGATAVLAVVPPDGSAAVDPAASITITFSGPMRTGMEMYVALHEGSVDGPRIAGTTGWSADRSSLTFTPAEPLKSQTTYALRIGGAMVDANGNRIDYARCRGQSQAGGGMAFIFRTA